MSSGTDKLAAAIAEVEARREAAQAFHDEHDVPGGWLDADGSWRDWESEAEGEAAQARIDALGEALTVLYAVQAGSEVPS